MQIIVLVGFMLTQIVPTVRAGGWAVCAVGLAGYWLVIAVLAGLTARQSVQPVAHARRRGGLYRLTGRVWLLLGLAGLIAIGWRDLLVELLPDVPLLGDWLLFLPFLAGLVLTWLLEYPTHRASRIRATGPGAPVWTRGQYLAYNLRHQVLFILVPVSAILLGTECLLMYLRPVLPTGAGGDLVTLGLTVGWAGAVFLVAPLMIARIWRTRPLPAGQVRDRLEELCSRLSVRCRDILLWQTDGVLANAGAMGLFGPVRYLLMTDALLERLAPEYVQAVFAHELGHVRHHHIFFAGLFAVSSVLLCSAAGWGLAVLFGAGLETENWLSLLLLVGAWAVGFGQVSRSFERQSDAVGAWASGPERPPADPADRSITPLGAEVFAGALQQVALLNGIGMGQRNWRHGPMGDRIDRVRRLGYLAGSREPADRTVRRVKGLLVAGVLAGAGLMGLRIALETIGS